MVLLMAGRFGISGQDQATAELEFWPNLCKVTLRVLAWPFIALLEVVSIPWRVSKDESDEFLLMLPSTLRRSLNACLDTAEADYIEDVKVVWSRVVAAYDVSLSFLIQISIYNILNFVWQKYGFSQLYKGLERKLENFLCTYWSGFYTTESGSVHTYSMTNIVSPSFDIPEKYEVDSSRFPLVMENFDNNGLSPIGHPFNSHFMIQLARLAHEHPDVVKDVICNKWNLIFNGFAFKECGALTPTDFENGLEQIVYRPDAAVYVCSNDKSIMIAFRGPGALNLVSWTSDTTFARFSIEDIGEVHVGIYNSLFNPREDSLYDKIISIISTPRNSSKSIFLTGYSFGGAMASVFATAVSRLPNVHGRLRGIYTYGQPRTGDESFAANFDSKYSDPLISLRFVNASDIVPKCPIDNGYCHHSAIRFITSFGDVVSETKSVELAENYEDRFAFFLGIYKVVCDFLYGSSLLSCGLRCCLIGLPGIFNSFATEYERNLREFANFYSTAATDSCDISSKEDVYPMNI